ncbi:hypothetical protein AUJ10_02545 [Candidatus Pacearchaeota archaeon CG1_02_31_27]|nr:MAG: hypothetical protein AUJ10_02545 [Candidatus Pacearchaeota archaeon CG1_02_31_27]PIN92472.1 MAG: type II toxin-antitoxin system RelE/ParE family toxin [Candidatus Pacearchaeota archaeon CG10_big_fil_rev_8_21_14_0_10_31_59]PIZ80962.1 MAG: type II toxin-antitoxin system RelE/ParE family toxin [Candidatus Pacearchaeota archaeon CG_4_10_14_0_2_um_filter_31_10]
MEKEFRINWTEKALDGIDELEPLIAKRITKKVSELAKNSSSLNIKRLKGEKAFRLRIGDYRIIFDINTAENSINILKVGHRKNIYER